MTAPGFSSAFTWATIRCFWPAYFRSGSGFRAEARGFPDLKYYEAIGRTQYRVASDHRLAQRYALAEVLSTLAERFQTTRLALNDLADRLFSLGDTNYTFEAPLSTGS